MFQFRSCFKTKSSPSQVKIISPDIKKYLNLHIKTQFDKDPEITAREVKKLLMTGNQPPASWSLDHQEKHSWSLHPLSTYKKLTVSGSLERVRGSGGQNKTPPRVVARIKSLIKTTWWSRTWSPPSPSISRLWLTFRGVRSPKRTTIVVSQLWFIYVKHLCLGTFLKKKICWWILVTNTEKLNFHWFCVLSFWLCLVFSR